jgi:cbb3-type cytochrome oxidase subunit 3
VNQVIAYLSPAIGFVVLVLFFLGLIVLLSRFGRRDEIRREVRRQLRPKRRQWWETFKR